MAATGDGVDDRSASCSESEGEGERENDDEVLRKKFEEIIGKLKNGKSDDAKDLAEEIYQGYSDCLSKAMQGEDRKTILHMIAVSARRKDIEKWLPITRKIIENFPGLMQETDKMGRNPLQKAVQGGRSRLVTTMCEATPKTAFDKIVRMKDSNSNNSLHDALNKEDPSRIAPELIQKINNPDDVLCELNGKGLSPLHIAVEYQQCTPSQFGIVKALIERSSKVLEVNVPPTEPGQRSVYLHHEKTRREAERTSHVNPNVESR